MVFAVLLAIIHSLVNYLSEFINIEKSRYKSCLVSLVAGISVTYILLHLLPNLYGEILILNKSLFIFVLVGFVVFHVTEKFIYKFVGKGRISEDLKLSHSFGLFFYDFSVGILLVHFVKIGILNGLLFFIPIFFHTALSSLSIHKIHGLHERKPQVLQNTFIKILLSGASLYGALIAFYYNLNLSFTYALAGIVTGILLYVVIREMIPKEKEGNPICFIIGVVLYSLLIFTIQNV